MRIVPVLASVFLSWSVNVAPVWVMLNSFCVVLYVSSPVSTNQTSFARLLLFLCLSHPASDAALCVDEIAESEESALSWVGPLRLQLDSRIQISFRKQLRWYWDAFWVWFFTFQDSDFFQKTVKMVLRCILSVIFHISGFRFLSENNSDGIEMHFECDFSHFRVRTLVWSLPLLLAVM